MRGLCVSQINRFHKAEDRAVLITDRHLYKMDPLKQYKPMKSIPLYNVWYSHPLTASCSTNTDGGSLGADFQKRFLKEVEIFSAQIYKTPDHVRLINMHQNSAYLCRIASDSIWLTCFTPERFQNEAPWIILAPEMSLLFLWVINLTRSLVWNSRQRIHISLGKMDLRVREVKEGSFWQIMLLCTWLIFCKQKRNRHFIPFLRICYSFESGLTDIILNRFIFRLQSSYKIL